MNWQEISGSWVLIPQQPIGIIHFLGGAFIGTTPNLTYRWMLEQLAKAGYVVIATPFLNTFDHTAIARSTLNRFESILERFYSSNQIQTYLPIYGVGHSLGSKLHLLIGSLYGVERAGNILISFNNYPVKRAIPLIEQLSIDTDALNIEFSPSPEETTQLITSDYQIRRNLLIKFSNDTLDQTKTIIPILQQRFSHMITLQKLSGNHLTPLGQDINWDTGDNFSALDALGQWVKQSFFKDLNTLSQEMLRWLNPGKNAFIG